ncbi:MAG: fluoride efflux transporter CrcB [Pseudomonadota bacterium]
MGCDRLGSDLALAAKLTYGRRMWTSLLFVGLGGAIGACLRYATGLIFVPLGAQAAAQATLLVNVAGSLLLGLLSAWAVERAMSPTVWLFFGVGVLGAFTTFSAFSRETVMMLVDGAMVRGFVYIAANLVGSLAAFGLGFFLLRRFLA